MSSIDDKRGSVGQGLAAGDAGAGLAPHSVAVELSAAAVTDSQQPSTVDTTHACIPGPDGPPSSARDSDAESDSSTAGSGGSGGGTPDAPLRPRAGSVQLRLRDLVLPLYLPHLCLSIGKEFVSAFLPLFARDDLGASDALVGVALAAAGFTKLASNVPSGALISKYGAGNGMLFACVLQALGAVVCAAAPNVWLVVLGRCLVGVGFSTMTISNQVFVSATIDVSRRGRAASWYGGLYRVGGVLGPLLGAAVAEAWSSRGALLLQTVWMVAAALAVILWFPRQPIGVRAARAGLPSTNSKPVQPIAPPSDVNSVTSDANSGPSATDAAPTGDESVVVQATPPGWRQTNACWNSHVMRIFRQYWYQLFTVGVFSALLQFIREARPLVFPLAGDSFGMSKTEIGLVMSLAAVCDTSLFWTSGLIMDNLGRKWNGVVVPTLIGIGYFFIPLGADHIAWFVAAVCLIGLGNSASAGLVFTLGSDCAPKDDRTAFIAVYRMLTDSGVLIGPLATGLITHLGSVCTASYTTTGVAAVAVVWMLLCVKETLRKKRPDADNDSSGEDSGNTDSVSSECSLKGATPAPISIPAPEPAQVGTAATACDGAQQDMVVAGGTTSGVGVEVEGVALTQPALRTGPAASDDTLAQEATVVCPTHSVQLITTDEAQVGAVEHPTPVDAGQQLA